MLQRYRIRLGDGTILHVDRDGLQAWLEDERAVVQVAGTQGWRPLRELLAEEESAARLARALVRPEPRWAPSPPPPEPEAPLPSLDPAIGAPPVQSLAEEPSAPTPPWQAPPEAPDSEAPAIRFKPLEDEPHAPAGEPEIVEAEPQDPYAVPRPRAYDTVGVEEEEVGRTDRLEGPLLHVVTAFGTLFSRLLDPLTPLVRGWPSRSPVGRAPQALARKPPRPARETSRAPAPPPPAPAPSFDSPPAFEPAPAEPPPPPLSVLAEDPSRAAASPLDGDAIPVVPLKPLEEDERPLTTAWRGFSEKAQRSVSRISEWFAAVSAWVAGLSGRAGGLRERNRRPEPVVPPIEPTRRKAPSATPSAPTTPRAPAPLRPPTPITEMPSIRLADGWEAPEEGEVYDGGQEGWSEAWSVLPVVWMWTKRVVLVGGLAAVGVLAARNWETWFPKAAELGQTVFTEIDRQTHSTQRSREREQALTNAIEQCPHLAPATIRLVLSTSSDGVLEPPEVFQVAAEAVDRGISTLPPAEAAELRGLQRELVAQLRPPQRARLAEYDRARATRGVFPFENPHALDLVARGARAMPAASRARLQELLGKAVAAGLGLPAASPAAAPADAGAAR